MKIFFSFVLLFGLSGCAQKDAFDMFGFTKEQKLSENSIQTLKVKDLNKNVVGMVSTIYLNEVYPDRYEDGEYFYVYFYVKGKKSLEFSLNGKEALHVELLKPKNRFSKLLNTQNSWSRYNLVKFEKTEDRKLTLKLKDKTLSFKGIIYKKED